MATDREEGPVYYREIQKNSYLKRIPNEPSISKLLPIGHKVCARRAVNAVLGFWKQGSLNVCLGALL